MTSSQTEWVRWAAAFDEAWLAAQSVHQMHCPTCGCRQLQLVYVIDDPSAADGMFAFWCDACLTGHPPGFGPLPEGVRRVRREEANIPNYRVVVEP